MLSRTLRTIIAQSRQDWKALVIGDACTDETAEIISNLGDDRIQFINLPERFGEQAGPNSVGMALSDTPYLAFMNHDDFWFPEHLETAIQCLNVQKCDLYWSRAAFFVNRGGWVDRPFFIEASEIGRNLEEVYDREFFFCEPLSCWVMRRDAMKRLGQMKLAGETVIPPVHEYGLRAAKLDISFTAGDAITVLKDGMWYPPPLYDNTNDFAEAWVKMIEIGETRELHQEIEDDLWLSNSLGLVRDSVIPKPGNRKVATEVIDRVADLNMLELDKAARGSKINLLGGVLSHRTGQNISEQPDLDKAILYAKQVMS